MAAVERTLTRQAFRDARTRTLVFAYLFAAYSYIQPVGYRTAYPDLPERLAFARSFGENRGLRLLYGEPFDVVSVGGYTAWRVGGTLAVAAALYGLLAGVRAWRAEEETGRMELVLAAPLARAAVVRSALLAVAAGIALLWVAELAGFVAGGLPLAGSAFLALATASVATVCAGLGLLASQVAPTRRSALGLGGAVVAGWFALRVVADTVDGLAWLRWGTPLGWAEELRPLTGARPAVLVLPLAATALTVALAAQLALRRDIGSGLLAARDSAEPRLRLLSSPAAQALRLELGVLAAWTAGVAAFAFILGGVSGSISDADVSAGVQKQIAKLGAGAITTASGYLAFVFVFFVAAISIFACAQVAAARDEEAEQRLETLLALPVGRRRWLGGRLVLALAAAAVLALAAGLFTWAGAAVSATGASLPDLLGAGANCLPAAILFGGLAALAYAIAPRAGTAIAYTLVAVAFLWYLVGSLLGAPRWLVDATPFAHVAHVPAQAFRPGAAAVMAGLGAMAALAAMERLRRRDLLGA